MNKEELIEHLCGDVYELRSVIKETGCELRLKDNTEYYHPFFRVKFPIINNVRGIHVKLMINSSLQERPTERADLGCFSQDHVDEANESMKVYLEAYLSAEGHGPPHYKTAHENNWMESDKIRSLSPLLD